MRASEDIPRLLQQWRQMTQAETEAIHTGAWPKLQEIHSSKALLQIPLNQALADWRARQSSHSRAGAVDPPLRTEVLRLIALESNNAQLLADRLKKARQRKAQLERAASNLRNIRCTYAPKNSGDLDSWS